MTDIVISIFLVLLDEGIVSSMNFKQVDYSFGEVSLLLVHCAPNEEALKLRKL